MIDIAAEAADYSARRGIVSASLVNPNRLTLSVALDARLIRQSDSMVVGQKFISADVAIRKSDMSLMADSYADGYNEAITQVVLWEGSEQTRSRR